MLLLVRLVRAGFQFIYWLIIFRVIISWVRPNFSDPRWRKILKFVYKVTEPILAPIRDLLPMGSMGIDLSPLIALIAIMIIRNFVMQILWGLV